MAVAWHLSRARTWRSRWRHPGRPPGRKVRRIEVILSGNPNKREQGVAPRVGQRGPHTLRRIDLADAADRPVRGHPLAGRMGKEGGKPDPPGLAVDRGGLNGRDLMLAEALAHELEPARERRIA